MRLQIGLVLVTLASQLVAPSGSSSLLADDLQPPPWTRGGTYTTLAEWDFLSPLPGAPDGQLLPIIGDGGNPSGSGPSFTVNNATWDSFDNGSWGGGLPSGGELIFDIPNWIDTEPIKHLWIQMTYQNPFTPQNPPPFGPVRVTDIQGFDANVANPAESLVSVIADGPIPGSSSGLWHRVEHWQILPNPDRELIFVYLPPDMPLTQIVIDSISIPEPSSLTLAALAALGLAVTIRRKRSAVKR